MIAFKLSMPNVGSWNGRWSGEGRDYVIVRTLGRDKQAGAREAEIVHGSPYRYSFGDGWTASISATAIEPSQARTLRRNSAGFAGYDWMVDEIVQHGRIMLLSERTA